MTSKSIIVHIPLCPLLTSAWKSSRNIILLLSLVVFLKLNYIGGRPSKTKNNYLESKVAAKVNWQSPLKLFLTQIFSCLQGFPADLTKIYINYNPSHSFKILNISKLKHVTPLWRVTLLLYPLSSTLIVFIEIFISI